jgi:hypothetical protein
VGSTYDMHVMEKEKIVFHLPGIERRLLERPADNNHAGITINKRDTPQ